MKPLNGQSGTDGFAVADSLLKTLDLNSIGSLVSLGADVVILGGAGLAGLAAKLKPMVDAAAKKYADEKKLPVRDCSKES